MVRTASKATFFWAVVAFGIWFLYSRAPGNDTYALALLFMFGFAFILVGLSIVSLRESAPQPPRPEVSPRSIWPILGAISVALVGAGFVINGWYLALAGVIGLWAVGGALGQAWREDLGWSAHFGDRLGERIVRPIGLPVVALIGIALIAISLSRVFLANNENTTLVIAIVIAAAMLVAFSVLSSKHLSPTLLAAIGALAVVLTVSFGVSAAKKGAVPVEHEGAGIPPTFTIGAQNLTFVNAPDKDPADKLIELKDVPADEKVEFDFHNFDDATVFHNVALYSGADGKQAVWNGTPVGGGGQARNTFTAPAPGVYTLRCDFHANMVAKVDVVTAKSSGDQ